ncbi:MAG TPA: DUF503 domain-containing protein [Solirubrobacteraceae bacterium]
MFVAILRVHLHFPDAGSLKAKRSELNSIKAHLRQRHGASVAEVAHQDTWQRSTLAVSLVGRSATIAAERADDVGRYLDARLEQGARIERRLASWDDLESVA